MIRILASLALLSYLSLALATETKNPVDIEEWTVPYEDSRPRDPFAVSPEAVWFVREREKGDRFIWRKGTDLFESEKR